MFVTSYDMSFDEFKQAFTVHKMGEKEIVATFDCGDDDLNGFILTDAPLYRKEKLAVTYTVLEKLAPQKVVAFFSLSNDRISVTDFDNRTKYNRFSRRFNNHKRLKSYPAAKIGRFAVDANMKGKEHWQHFVALYQAVFRYRQQDWLSIPHG